MTQFEKFVYQDFKVMAKMYLLARDANKAYVAFSTSPENIKILTKSSGMLFKICDKYNITEKVAMEMIKTPTYETIVHAFANRFAAFEQKTDESEEKEVEAE